MTSRKGTVDWNYGWPNKWIQLISSANNFERTPQLHCAFSFSLQKTSSSKLCWVPGLVARVSFFHLSSVVSLHQTRVALSFTDCLIQNISVKNSNLFACWKNQCTVLKTHGLQHCPVFELEQWCATCGRMRSSLKLMRLCTCKLKCITWQPCINKHIVYCTRIPSRNVANLSVWKQNSGNTNLNANRHLPPWKSRQRTKFF